MSKVWAGWKRLAGRAAEVQGEVLFFLLYFLVLVPIALLSSPRTIFGRRLRARPAWQRKEPSSSALDAARRQY
jgi:hypothetical protein